ncbi:MAG TPA: sigma-70 family RNA polymerase sigma factor [Erythrobacter sp.]|nr:sigma-70 family RNA polymerase sigma factor [Erythrobacter sp.]
MKQDHTQFGAVQAYADRAVVEDRVRRFSPMVRRAAWHLHGMASSALEVEDLIQAGMVALTECARRHGSSGEDGFAAYAKLRVRGAMVDQIRRAMPGSRAAAGKLRAYDEAVGQLGSELGRVPSPAEISARLGCTAAQLREIEAGRISVGSIDESYNESDLAFADDSPDPFEALAAMDDRARLVAAMEQLPQRLQLVLQLNFVEELNLTEIAEVLDVSVPRVHQLRAQALAKLRTMLEEPA